MVRPHKLVIVGVGHVGSYVLADAMKMNLFAEIVTIDIADGVAHGEALDQHHATALSSLASTHVRAGDYEECTDADIIICAAGPSIIPSDDNDTPDRASLAAINAAVIRDVMSKITAYTNDAIIIMITNPLDTMLYVAENEFDYPSGKIFGTGTMLDSARLRRIVADELGVSPASVSGYMMGEHGLSAFPVLSHLTVGGMGVDELRAQAPEARLEPDFLAESTVRAAYDVLNSKGWTNAGVAQAAVLMARHVLLDEKVIVPACTTLRGEYGYDGTVALSMPSLLGKNGVEKRFEVRLNAWEQEALEKSVNAISEAITVAQQH